MCQIVKVEIFGLKSNKPLGFDDFGEYDRATRSLHLTTTRWKVKPDELLGSKLTIKGSYKDDGGLFVNDMVFAGAESDFTQCWFQGPRT